MDVMVLAQTDVLTLVKMDAVVIMALQMHLVHAGAVLIAIVYADLRAKIHVLDVIIPVKMHVFRRAK